MCHEKMLRVAHLCCGIGGTALGFKEAGFVPVYANDCCELVARTFEENLQLSVDLKDINRIDLQKLPDFEVLTASLMRQPILVSSDQAFNNPIFKGIHRVIQYAKPKVFCLDTLYTSSLDDENPLWCQDAMIFFEELGYTIKTVVLSDRETGGCPTSRKEQFILGFLDAKQAERFKGVQPVTKKQTLNDCLQLEVEQSKAYYFDRFNPSTHYQTIQSFIPEEPGVYRLTEIYRPVKEMSADNVKPLDLTKGTMQIFSGFEKRPNTIIRDNKGVRVPTVEEWLQIKGFPSTFQLSSKPTRQLKTLTSQYREAALQLGLAMCPPLAKQVALAIKETF